MRCIEALAGAVLILLTGCAAKLPSTEPPPLPVPLAVAPAPLALPPPVAPPPAPVLEPPLPAASAAQAPVPPRVPRYVQLGPAATPRSPAELRLQLARRLVAAHPDTSYTQRAPDRLLAIPVLEIELNADGSVRGIEVLRKPSTGNEATQLAIAAVRRAAPYGNVSRLPKPWKIVETFLFDDELRFKPRTLDLQ